MNLSQKSELNNPQVQLTAGNFFRKRGQNYLRSIASLSMLKILEAVVAAKGVILMNQKFKKFFVFFLFQFVFIVSQEDLY